MAAPTKPSVDRVDNALKVANPASAPTVAPIYSPAYGIQLILQSVGVVDGDSGWTSATGQEPDQPDKMVTIYDRGGRAPEVVVGINWPEVQFIVRGGMLDYNGAYGQCIAIRNAIQAIPDQPVWPELTSVWERTDIQNLGRDGASRPRLSMNYQLITTPVDPGYRM
jgi:hypothetical protein